MHGLLASQRTLRVLRMIRQTVGTANIDNSGVVTILRIIGAAMDYMTSESVPESTVIGAHSSRRQGTNEYGCKNDRQLTL